ncbi:MAG: hypothetical protein LH491_04360 [Pseudoxanthomonas sp.]|nr:hypothetical protein [Pseudoxanthomonas sp.]
MSNTKHSLLTTAVMGGLLLAGAAGAQQGNDMFSQMDTDGDGRLSAQEHAAGAAALFTRTDANRDGKVANDEMMPMVPHAGPGHGGAMMDGGMKHDSMKHDSMKHDSMKHDSMKHDGMGHDNMMMMADSNQDGAVTAAEHAAHAKAMFERMDANHDGRINATEMDAGQQGMHGQGDMRAMMDSNHDGTITAAEHTAGASARFARIDANRDGFVSRAEFDASRQAMRTP